MPSSGVLIAIVDTGPLYATIDLDDDWHEPSIELLSRGDLELVTSALVVAETAQLAGLRLGARAEAGFLRGLRALEVELPSAGDWSRIADLVERYGDLPLGAVDASLVVLAERFDTDLLMTLDRRHFTVVRPEHCEAFELLPELEA